mgnify:FL=1
MKEISKYLLGFALAAILLAFFLRGVDGAGLVEALRGASFAGIVLAAAVNLAHNVFRTWRWRSLLAPVRSDVAFRPMFVAIIVGFLTTWVLPGRLGELVRPALLSTRERIPIGPCLGSVVADRILDGAAILLLFAVGAWSTPLAGAAAESLRGAAVVMVIVVATFLAGSVVAGSFRGAIGRFVEGRRGALRGLGRLFLAVAEGTEALRRPRLLGAVALHSVLAWLTIAAGIWIGVRALGAAVPFPAVLVMLPIMAFGVAVPTPGGTGGYHLAMKAGLAGLFGVGEASAAAAGILMHLAVIVPVIVLGLVFLRTERVSWHDLLVAARGLRDVGSRAAGRVSPDALEEPR